jgi:hypothetical protein
MIETAIIILNWHTPELVQKCIDSVEQSGYDLDKLGFVVVEQEKIDYIFYKTKIPGQNFIIHLNETNVGVPKGYNQGIQIALESLNPKYIIIMNSDTEMLGGCLEELIRCAESDPKIGIVGGKALSYGEDPKHPHHGGIVVFRQGDIIGREIDIPPGAPDLNVDLENYCVGFACALIKAEVFKDVGLFDEAYSPCDYEDTDFCFAARSKGWKVMSCIAAKYYHLEGATIKKKKFNLGPIYDRNRKYFAEKWKDIL